MPKSRRRKAGKKKVLADRAVMRAKGLRKAPARVCYDPGKNPYPQNYLKGTDK